MFKETIADLARFLAPGQFVISKLKLHHQLFRKTNLLKSRL